MYFCTPPVPLRLLSGTTNCQRSTAVRFRTTTFVQTAVYMVRIYKCQYLYIVPWWRLTLGQNKSQIDNCVVLGCRVLFLWFLSLRNSKMCIKISSQRQKSIIWKPMTHNIAIKVQEIELSHRYFFYILIMIRLVIYFLRKRMEKERLSECRTVNFSV